MNAFSGAIRPEVRLLPLVQMGSIQTPDNGKYFEKYARELERFSEDRLQDVPSHIRTAFEAAHAVEAQIMWIRENSLQTLSDTSADIQKLEQRIRDLTSALRGCSPHDLHQLERLVASEDIVYRGQIDFNERMPAWLTPMVEQLERDGKL
jgi:hypothetical protein